MFQVETALEQGESLRDFSRYRAILACVGLKRRTVGEIAAAMGQASDGALKRMVKMLVDLEYLEEERNHDASRNQAHRYRIADPAQRFYYGLVMPNVSAIASLGPDRVWRERLLPEVWPSYVGFEVFEDVVRQGYLRHAAHATCRRWRRGAAGRGRTVNAATSRSTSSRRCWTSE